MPHVVLDNANEITPAARGLTPFAERSNDEMLRVLEIFVSQSGRTLLIDCVAIEKGAPRPFFALVSHKDRQVTVRLSPLTDPEKTHGVKRLLAMIALRVRDLLPGTTIGKTNLQDYLT